MLDRALELLRRMDEFSQSRFRLEARYHHVLVDEFQDTSRAQWELVALLIQSWGEGSWRDEQARRSSSSATASSRSTDSVMQRQRCCRRRRGTSRPFGPPANPRRSITRSFRALPTLLAFVNELFCGDGRRGAVAGGRFTYTESDRFPRRTATRIARTRMHGTGSAGRDADTDPGPAEAIRQLGIAAANDPVVCAGAGGGRDRADSARGQRSRSQDRRAASGAAGDIGVLFRSRASHREFERELERRGVPAYVYKGLGFFDADETKDAMALIRLPRQPGVRPARGGVSALAFHPSIRRRAVRRWRRAWPAALMADTDDGSTGARIAGSG